MAIVAAAMAIPAAMLPVATAAAVAPPSVDLVSSSSWQEPATGTAEAVHIVGQVKNNTSGSVTVNRINVALYDSHAINFYTPYTDATVNVLGPGEVSPFELVLHPPPTNYASYQIGAITHTTATSQPYHTQLAATLGPCPSGFSADYVCGSVANTGGVGVDGVRAILTYVDSANTTVAVEHPMVDGSIAAGATGTFYTTLAPDEPTGTGSPVLLAEPDYPIDVSAVPLDLGHVNVGKTGQEALTLFNTGSSLPVKVGAVQASPTSEFSASTDCPSAGLSGGQSCHVTVQFTPAALGTRTGTLTIADDAAGTPLTVPLTGTGSAPHVSFSPSTQLDFGSTERAGQPGLTKNVSLINDGTGSLTITSVGTDRSPTFSADASACPASPNTLAAGNRCTIFVTFATMVAGPYTANLAVADDAGTGTQTLSLVAFASGPGDVPSPTSIDFHQVVVNQTSPPVGVTLTNNGNETLTISAINVTGDFGKDDGCGTPFPVTLAAGASCTVNVRFTPTQSGNRSGSLTITDNTAVGQQSVSLIGTGATSALFFSRSSLDFGTRSPGSATMLTDTVTNLGTTPLVMTAITASGDYGVTHNCPISPASLPTNTSCLLTVTFRPTDLGTRNGAITISDNTPAGTDILPLTGNAQVSRAMYTLDGYGGIHSDGGSPALSATAYWPGWKIARSAALLPDGSGGYVLDGYGGVHQFGSARIIPTGSYPYFGFNIARDVALLPSATPQNPMGYTLDGFGGVHPFGGAGAASGYSYYAGRDIVLKIVLLSDGTGGYTLDAYGGLHPFAIRVNNTSTMPPAISNNSYWPGWRIVRGVALNPNSTTTAVSGVTLDAYGGVHSFNSAGAPGLVNPQGPYFGGWDISRAVVLSGASTAAHPQGWVLDGWGGLHAFGGAPNVASGAYWPNFDIAVHLIGR